VIRKSGKRKAESQTKSGNIKRKSGKRIAVNVSRTGFSMSGLTSAATIKMGRDTVPVAGLVQHATRARARFLRRGVAATPWPRHHSAPI